TSWASVTSASAMSGLIHGNWCSVARMVRVALAMLLALAACGPGSPGGPTMNNRINAPDPVPQSSKVVSADILSREPVANRAQVKHILISWKDLDSARDERAQQRTKEQAEAQVSSLMGQIRA